MLAGLADNFWRARYLDTHMARTAALADALADGDRLLRAAHRRSDFAALKFAPAHALIASAIVAGPQRCAPARGNERRLEGMVSIIFRSDGKAYFYNALRVSRHCLCVSHPSAC